MIRKNLLKKALLQEEVVFGTWSVLQSFTAVEMLAKTPLNFIIFDREHDSISYERIANYVTCCFLHGVTPIVRIPEITISEVQRALDSGAQGLHIPNISSPKQVEELIKLALFPPIGKRGFSPFTKACGYQKENAVSMLQETNEELLLVIHIENLEGIKNISKLLSYDPIEVFFIGLFDLANSMGLPGDIRHPYLQEVVKVAVKEIREKGKIPGTIATTLEQAEYLLELGFQYITVSSDVDRLFLSYTNFLEKLNYTKSVYGFKS